jgi:hypothetical protein
MEVHPPKRADSLGWVNLVSFVNLFPHLYHTRARACARTRKVAKKVHKVHEVH